MRSLTLALLGLVLCAFSPWRAHAFEIACDSSGPQVNIPAGTLHLYEFFETQDEAEAALAAWSIADANNVLRTFLPPDSVCAECYDPWQCWERLRASGLNLQVAVVQDKFTGMFQLEVKFLDAAWVQMTCLPCVMCGDCGGG